MKYKHREAKLYEIDSCLDGRKLGGVMTGVLRLEIVKEKIIPIYVFP